MIRRPPDTPWHRGYPMRADEAPRSPEREILRVAGGAPQSGVSMYLSRAYETRISHTYGLYRCTTTGGGLCGIGTRDGTRPMWGTGMEVLWVGGVLSGALLRC
jgi:hypothetical protein